MDKMLKTAQHAIYKFEGSLNKFLLDDKGSTLVGVFGLAPLSHEDDPARGVLCALQICADIQCASVGVTTGTAFCGTVGERQRREYSVLGDVVNLSARLMSHVKNGKDAGGRHSGGVLVDETTYKLARHCGIEFFDLPPIKLKG